MAGTVCFTFDYWPSAFTKAFQPMAAVGISGTVYVAPETIRSEASNPRPANNLDLMISDAELKFMKMKGWEVAPYTNVQMVNLCNSNRNTAFDKLKSLDDAMHSYGFPTATIAPNERAWDDRLANMARGRFKGVRVCKTGPLVQGYPIADPMFVNGGAFASLGPGTTLQSATDAMDAAIAANGMVVFVIHNIGVVPPADPNYGLYVPDSMFTSILAAAVTRRDAGMRVCTFERALTPI